MGTVRRGGWTRKVLQSAAGLLLLVTALPFIPSNEWWIRLWDFPRAQIAVALLVVAAAFVLAGLARTRVGAATIALLIAGLAYQVARIWPYSPFHPEEVAHAPNCPANARLRLLEANVLQHNRDAGPLLRLVARERPDVLLLTETDEWWARQLRPLYAAFPHHVSVPLPNTYGMMLFSRLPLPGAEVRTLLEPDVPSIRTGLLLRNGDLVDFHAVHPRPPVPGQDTAARDAELAVVGRQVRAARRPAIVAGDMNDVAWSDSARLFREVSGLRDPRVGRALLPTYPAAYPGFRWPLDYVFVSPGFTLNLQRRLGRIGSDHLPMLVDLCAANLPRRAGPKPRLDADEREQVREVIREGVQEVREDLRRAE